MSRRLLATLAVIIACLLAGGTSQAIFAQESGRGTTLVCVNEGGDFPYVDEWTHEKLADFEARAGRDLTEIAVNPATGNCTDLAGLIRGWSSGTAWLCTPQRDGTWSGPGWVWPMYQSSNQIPPDSETGSCPGLSSGFQTGRNELEKAAAIAVYLTQLESAGDYDRLYAWMHPDSKTVVPEAAMEGWYQEVFATRPPVWMTVDDVRLVEWTWDVTGKVYPSAAEVSYRQRFEDGEEIAGIVRLVRDNGVWRWFFGRDRAFVEEQIARYE